MTFPERLDAKMYTPIPTDAKDVSETRPDGVLTGSERNHDQNRDGLMEHLSKGRSELEPMNVDEDKATPAEDAPKRQDTYAPASERVAKAPTPGDLEYLEAHTDPATPERIMSGSDISDLKSDSTHEMNLPAGLDAANTAGNPSNKAGEIPKTGARPMHDSSAHSTAATPSYEPGQVRPAPTPMRPPVSSYTQPSYPEDRRSYQESQSRDWMGAPLAGTLGMAAVAAGGAFAFMNWNRERNKPVNRVRRRLQGASKDLSKVGSRAGKEVSRMSAAAMERAPENAGPLGISSSLLLTLALAGARYLATRSQETPVERARDEASGLLGRLDLDRSRGLLERYAGTSKELFGMGADRAQGSLKKAASDKRVKGALKDARGRMNEAKSRVEKTEASPRLLGIGGAPILLGILGFIGWKLWDSNREAAAPDYYVNPSHA